MSWEVSTFLFWQADGTTLGADNGIGVATALALLDLPPGAAQPLPPLECLFTVDEETGLTGAFDLDPSLLSGTATHVPLSLLLIDSIDRIGHYYDCQAAPCRKLAGSTMLLAQWEGHPWRLRRRQDGLVERTSADCESKGKVVHWLLADIVMLKRNTACRQDAAEPGHRGLGRNFHWMRRGRRLHDYPACGA